MLILRRPRQLLQRLDILLPNTLYEFVEHLMAHIQIAAANLSNGVRMYHVLASSGDNRDTGSCAAAFHSVRAAFMAIRLSATAVRRATKHALGVGETGHGIALGTGGARNNIGWKNV
jgi:hypothetical protein